MINLKFKFENTLLFSKNSLLPTLILGGFLVYFCSISNFSDDTYQTIHSIFIAISITTFILSLYFHTLNIAVMTSLVYTSYFIINSLRYTYGEDYMFSSGYNIWIMMLFPNILVSCMYLKYKSNRMISWFFVMLFIQTAIIEKLQNQTIDADSYYFYKHIGEYNYPALLVSLISIFIIFCRYVNKGYILNASTLFVSLAMFIAVYLSDNLFAFSLFSLSASLILFISLIYYVYYISLKDEELNISNFSAYYHDAEKKYPLKYSISLMYIDDYERLLKRFGYHKMVLLKKMFVSRIHKINPNIGVYNYKKDAMILTFMNINANECFQQVEEIRRALVKSIFIFNENTHLQLTVSQCVSEKKRSDADSIVVLERAEKNLQNACKFTRNITVKA